MDPGYESVGRAPMRDFWLACGHHLTERNADGRLLVTDEFLKAYLARPELAPPSDACAVERGLRAALLAIRAARSAPTRLRQLRTWTHGKIGS